ncbi:MAG: tetratricopeptide repeat protein [Bacteroidaceae bacterium]|nr:tetratricopeptide repeat protein [Bacteroidaceae bacterium]
MKRQTLYLFVGVVTMLFACDHDLKADTNDSITTAQLGRDSLYLQLFGGINKSANENLPMSEFTSYPWSFGMFMGIGKEFNAIWGWRAALRLNHNKSRNVPRCETDDVYSWNSLGLFADATFDISDALVKAPKRGKRINIKAFAGVGLSYAFNYPESLPLSYSVAYSNKSKIVPGMRAGLNATYRLNETWRVGMELSHNMYGDNFNGVKDGAPFDHRTNLKVGVTMLLGKKKKNTSTPPTVVYDHRLREVPSLPFIMPKADETNTRNLHGRAFLDFPVNETFIDPKYRRNPEELQRLHATIDSALFDKTFKVKLVTLHGYASPESPYSNNTRLARGRTQSLKDYICKNFDIDPSLIRTNYTPEDWANLRSFIETKGNSRRVKGDIWYEHQSVTETPEMPDYVADCRKELLKIIDSSLQPDKKEEQLKQVDGGRPYKWLLQHVYPGLRHTDYTIEYQADYYTIEQSRRLIYTHPEVLKLKEMYLVAKSYEEGTDGWFDALQTAAQQYPNNPTANLNAASACVKMHRMTDAKAYLDKAGTSPEANYLRDIVKAMEGKAKWKMEGDKIIISK